MHTLNMYAVDLLDKSDSSRLHLTDYYSNDKLHLIKDAFSWLQNNLKSF